MNIRALQEYITSKTTEGTLTLKPGMLPSADIDRFIIEHFTRDPELKRPELTFHQLELRSAGETLEVNANVQMYGQQPGKLTGIFYIHNETPQFTFQLKIADFDFSKAFAVYRKRNSAYLTFKAVELNLLTIPAGTQPAGVLFKGEYQLSPLLSGVLFLLNNQEKFILEGAIQVDQGIPRFDFKSKLIEGVPLGNSHVSVNFHFGVRSMLIDGLRERRIPVPYMSITSGITLKTTQGDKTVALNLDLPWEKPGLLELAANSDQVTLSDLTALNPFCGAEGFSIPAEIPIADQIALRQFRLVISPAKKQIVSISVGIGSAKPWVWIQDRFALEDLGLHFQIDSPFDSRNRRIHVQVSGTFRFGKDVLLDAEIAWPQKTLTAGLKKGTKLELEPIIKNYFPDSPLQKLAIHQLFFSFDLGNYDFYFQIGIQNKWPVKIGEITINLDQIDVDFSVSQQKPSGSIAAIWDLDTCKIQVGAAHARGDKGWDFYGQTLGNSSLSLKKIAGTLAQVFGADLPENTPDIEVSQVYVHFNTASKAFEFSLTTKLKQEVPLLLNTKEVEVSVALNSAIDNETGKRSFTGQFGGEILLEASRLGINFNFGETKTVKGYWLGEPGKTLQPKDIARLIGINTLPDIPEGLDVGLTQLSFEYNITNKYFTLAAKSLKLGDAFMTAGKTTDGGFGLVFGINAPPLSRLSQLPGIGTYLTAADFITVKQAAIIVATGTFKDYVIPELPDVMSITLPEKSDGEHSLQYSTVHPVGNDTKLQLKRGVSLAVVIDFAAPDGKEEMKHLRQIIGETELTVQLTFSISPIALELFIGLKGQLSIPVSDNEQLKIGDASLEISITTTAVIFKLMGLVKVVVYDQSITARALLVVSTSQIQVSLNIEGENISLIPPEFSAIRLDEIGLAMGVFFQPPSFGFGVTGKYRLGEPAIKQDHFGIMLEVIQTVPNVKYLSFYVGEIDIETIYRLFLPAQANEENFLNAMKGRDISFYMSQGTVVLPDGVTATPGLGFSGTFRLFDFGFQGIFKVKTDTGISGRASCTPLNLRNILKLTGEGEEVKEKQAFVNGQWRRIDNSTVLPVQPKPEIREMTLIEQGGPVLRLSTTESPYLKINWKVSLFDVVNQEVDAVIANEGIKFSLAFAVQGVTDFKLDCVVQNWTSFRAEQRFNFAINEKIGPVRIGEINLGSFHLNINISNHILIILNSNVFSLDLNGKFEFQSLSFVIPQISLSVAPSQLGNIARDVVNQLKLEAGKVFTPITRELEKYLDLVKKGIITEVENMAKVLKDIYAQTAEQAAQILKDLQYAVEQIVAGLRDVYALVGRQIVNILGDLAYSANEIAKAVQTALQMAYGEFVALMMGRQVDLGVISLALIEVYKISVVELVRHLNTIGAAIEHIVNILGKYIRIGAREVVSQLLQAGLIPESFAKFITAVLEVDMNTVLQYLKENGIQLDQLIRVMHQSYHAGVEVIIRTMMSLNYDLFNIIVSVQQQIENDLLNIIRALNAIGIDLTVIADILKRMGQDFFQIIHLLRQVIDLGWNAVWDLLKALGAGITDILDVLRRIFGGLSASELYQYSMEKDEKAEEIVPLLQTICQLDAKACLLLLKQNHLENQQMVKLVADTYGISKNRMSEYMSDLEPDLAEVHRVVDLVYPEG